MKRLIYLLILALCAVGTATARNVRVNVGPFTKLNVIDNLNVVCICDSTQKGIATYECTEELVDALLFTTKKNGELKVQLSADFIGRNVTLPVIYVYTEFLAEVESSSTGTVDIKEVPRGPLFKASLFGNGTLRLHDMDMYKIEAALKTGHGSIQITGNTQDALLKLAGAGNIDASRLTADKVSCHVFGGGNIHCNPQNELKLKGLGSTTVYYKGNPATVKKQGLGKLVKIND